MLTVSKGVLPHTLFHPPWGSSILPAMQTCPKLPNRLQKVDIVAANKILCQVDDGGHETSLKKQITEKKAHERKSYC